jgi:DNA polymerase I-like protein with 3'-5' exonuclease and polymerase domains
MTRFVGLDTETYDPYLTERGPSWVFGEGHVICTSLYYEEKGIKKVVKGATEEVRALLLDENVTLIGANILYDLGWLEYHFGMQGKSKCKFICVIIAETLLDEYDLKSLEHLSEKYLDRHKTKSDLEAWCADNGLKGDFRKHLKDAPWALVKAYAADDAELPVFVYRKQEPLLLAQELMKPFGIDCALIPIVNRMKQVGIRIDLEKRKENFELMTSVSEELTSEFRAKYGTVNFNSPKQISALMDRFDIPYRVKFTVNGRNGRKYGADGLRKGKVEVSEFVKGFSISKKKLTCYVEKKYRLKMKALLDAEGFSYSDNPNVDKKFLAAVAEEYPVTKLIAAIKQVDGIISKFLGPNFDRFITKEGRVHCSFNISKSEDYGTISGRFSCLAKGTKILTGRGVVNIEDVLSGDVIVTHTGKQARVLKLLDNGQREVIRLTGKKIRDIICTKDHRFFTPDGWKEAADLKEAYHVNMSDYTERRERSEECCDAVYERNEARGKRSCFDNGNVCSDSEEDSLRHVDERTVQGREGYTVLEGEARSSEPHVGEDGGSAPKLEGRVLGQQETSYDDCGWEKVLRAPDSVRQVFGDASEGTSDELGRAPHRRESREQLHRQPRVNDEISTQKFTPEVEAITVEHLVGTVQVFDLVIDDEDHSFLAGGLLAHNCSAPNLQQIPSKGKIFEGTDREIDLAEICRELFIADEGCDLLKIDYSQIEYRLLVHYARGPGAQDAKNAFIADPKTDYHQFVMDLTGLARKFAKNCNFGIMYGMGPSGMMSAFAWTREHVDEILEKYHSALPYVKPTMQAVSDKAEKVGFIRTIGGRKARLRNKDLGYTMLNRLNQGGSADMMKTAMVDSFDSGIFFTELGLVPHLTIHDELVCSVPRTEEGKEAVLRLRYIMEHCIELKIPVIAEPEMGPDWFHVEKEESAS